MHKGRTDESGIDRNAGRRGGHDRSYQPFRGKRDGASDIGRQEFGEQITRSAPAPRARATVSIAGILDCPSRRSDAAGGAATAGVPLPTRQSNRGSRAGEVTASVEMPVWGRDYPAGPGRRGEPFLRHAPTTWEMFVGVRIPALIDHIYELGKVSGGKFARTPLH